MNKIAILFGGIVLGTFVPQEAADPKDFRAMITPGDTVMFRGEAALSNRTATVQLPSNYATLAKASGATITLTCKDGWSPLSATAISGTSFTVSTTESGASTQAFWWEVKVAANGSAFGLAD